MMIDMTTETSIRLAPGLYLANGHSIELIDADHDCAGLAPFLPCWSVDSGDEIVAYTDTKRQALAIVADEPTGSATDGAY